MFQTAFNGNLIKVGNAGIHEATRGLEDHGPAVGAPAYDRVIGGMIGKLLYCAAFGRDDEDVIIAIAV